MVGILVETTGQCKQLIYFFFNDTATTEIYTLSLHDALPIPAAHRHHRLDREHHAGLELRPPSRLAEVRHLRSEEHTSELQSPCNIVCRLLLEKKKKNNKSVFCNEKKNNNIIIA